jgi:hypothetical protein
MSIPGAIEEPFMAAVGIAAACMPLECPEPPENEEGYEPFGICNLMLKLALGSIAPFLPMLNIVLDVDIPGFLELPGLAVELPALPFKLIAPGLPPIPIPEIGTIGDMDLPELPALGALVFALLTIPLDIAIGLLSLDIPDLSFDGLLDLVLPAIAAGLEIPALMIPTLGLLDLAICVIALIVLPVILIFGAMGPILEALELAGEDVPDIPDIPQEVLTDAEKRAKAEAALNRMVMKEAAAEAAARGPADHNDDMTWGKKARWRPKLGDDFYG